MTGIADYTKTCPEGVYEAEFKVTKEMTAGNEQMQPGDFARELEKITEAHLRSFGMNRESLLEEKKIWVISWNDIRISRLPKVGETVILRVWAGKKRAGMFSRFYGCYSAQGEALAGASSFFTLIDAETRTIAAPTEKIEQIPVVSLANEGKLPKMIQVFPENFAQQTERVVAPDEIDKNGHLNNTHYIDWAEDVVKDACGEERMPTSVWIRYEKELLVNETVTLKYTMEKDKLYLQGFRGEELSFSVILSYEI